MAGAEESGSPYAPHTAADVTAMLETLGVASVEDLFDIPEPVRFEGAFGLPARDERAARDHVTGLLERNDDLTELLGRGHHATYVPAAVDHLADRSEFLTSYTQYQPEVSQGFLQALFEYQSLLVELTGLPVANASMYDAASALGEAATLADRVRETDGHRVLVPEALRTGRRETLENYVAGADLTVESYPMADGIADVEALESLVDDTAVMVYAETPTVRGPIEEGLAAIGELAGAADALFVVGSDPIALSVLERPADAGADVVVGEASGLGLSTSFGMGLGLFAAREAHLRQLPGRLVGATTDASGRRAYTLTLQTREQHIRRERATSNVCTNQAWVALRVAMHAALLGPEGLCSLADRDYRASADLAASLDAMSGVTAPVHDRHHLREFVCAVDDAPAVAAALADRGFAVHALGPEELQVCVSGVDADALERFVTAVEEVVG